MKETLDAKTVDLKMFSRLLKYSDRYEINIQFWPDQTAVYIAKDGIDLNSWGGYEKNYAIKYAVMYLDKINRVGTKF